MPTEMTRGVIYRVHRIIQPAGPIAGNRFCAIEQVLEWIVDLDLICVSVEYRLAPEHQHPAGLLDCSHVLEYLVQNMYLFKDPRLIGIDATNLCLVSGMGGAAIAASLALPALNKKKSLSWTGWKGLKGMLLYSHMLRCKMDGTSVAQFNLGDIWDTVQVERIWAPYNGESMSHRASPGLADNLRGLPSTYIEVGACETHRSEATRFADQIWRDGGDCELHVWAGGCCNFPYWFPGLAVSKTAIQARRDWLERTLCGMEEDTGGLSPWTEELLTKREIDKEVHQEWMSVERDEYYQH